MRTAFCKFDRLLSLALSGMVVFEVEDLLDLDEELAGICRRSDEIAEMLVSGVSRGQLIISIASSGANGNDKRISKGTCQEILPDKGNNNKL